MTPMAALAAAHVAGRRTPGRLRRLTQPLFAAGALAMGVGELFGDTMKSAGPPWRRGAVNEAAPVWRSPPPPRWPT